MSIETFTVRERLQDELKGMHVEAAVFTTYNLVPEFFEQNVLPALFNVEGSGRVRRRVQVNRYLASAPVAVFYDMSTQPKGGGEFRYQLVPVRPNKGGAFHPKLALVVARGEEEGDEPEVLVCVASANLTIKGWGHNVEAAGVFWVSTEEQRDELLALVEYLQKQATRAVISEGATGATTEVEALGRARERLRGLEHLSRTATDQPEFRCFGLRRREEIAPATVIAPGRSYWQTVTAFSPYWSNKEDVLALCKQLRTRACVLVPAPKATGERVSLGVDEESATAERKVVDEPARRFRHAKLYLAEGRFRGKERARITLGSANFTTAAFGKGEGQPINVEALIAYEVTPRQIGDIVPELEELPDEVVVSPEGINEESEEAPLPFDIFVAYDWPRREYRVDLACKGSACDFSLRLPAVGQRAISPGEPIVIESAEGPTTSKSFSLWYRKDEYDSEGQLAHGLITELGLDESDHKYTPTLKLDDFFASWFRRDPAGVLDDIASAQIDEDAEAGPLEALDDVPVDQLDATNLFDMYRALSRLEATHLVPAVEAKRQGAVREYLVTRPDSIDQLARVLERQTTNIGVRFALLLECQRLFATYGGRFLGEIGDRARARIDGMLEESMAAVLAELAESKRVGPSATDTVAWFEQQLTEAWR